jgi:hypothetical protein
MMATHDYVIDNQAAPAFRADLNSVLQAIVSNNASATAPSTTYANMLWYDTAANTLKKRNEANSGWITIGTFDEGTGTFSATNADAVDGKSFGTFTAAGGVLYATAADAAAAIGAGTAGQVLTSGGAGAPTWTTPVVGGMTLLGTLTTTSGATQTLSGLDLTGYKALFIDVDGVSANSSGVNLRFMSSGIAIGAALTGPTYVWNGRVLVALGSGIGDAWIIMSVAVTPPNPMSSPALSYFESGLSDASTSVTFSVSAGAFDAGAIRIYGVR